MIEIAKKIKRILNPSYWFLRTYSLLLKLKINKCGDRFRAEFPLIVLEGKNITIGNNFYARKSSYLYANDNGSLIIGDNCAINTNVQLGASGGKIIIGNNVLIAPNVVIRCSNHKINRNALVREQGHIAGEIVIEDDVWIGSNAVITSGVCLAEGTVVGAGAVVTKSTERYSIVGGVPARKIGERI